MGGIVCLVGDFEKFDFELLFDVYWGIVIVLDV